MGSHRVGLVQGDGIGAEISDAVKEIIAAAGAPLDWVEVPIGAKAVEQLGALIPPSSLELIAGCEALLKGPLATPIGGGHSSPNVALRQHFDLYANVRPAQNIPGVKTRFEGVNLVVVRENTEGLYSGIEHYIPPNRSAAEAVAIVTRHGSQRVIRFAFEYARRKKRSKVTVFHKANILKKTSGLFLEVAREIAADFPEIELQEMIIDNACMQLVRRPEQFEVIVTTNLFGDIVSDLAAGLVGGLGLTPSANLGAGVGMFEAVHGTAPDIAGKGVANPTALLLSATMMLEHLHLDEAADRIRRAVFSVLGEGKCVTADLGGTANTRAYTDALVARVRQG